MPEPKLELAAKYLTAPQARQRLRLSRFQFDIRIERGVFPKPTYVDVVKNTRVRYFDENWVRIAQAILDNAPNTSSDKNNQATEGPVA
ncbi:hypothetical protein ES703_125708 [subsurface metagenome]